MIIRFDVFSLDTEGYVLSKGVEPVALEPQVFDLLRYLAENRDRVVSKDELIENIWDGRIVSDAAITSTINLARRAVEDDGKTQAVIKTFPRRGFRFVAEVEEDLAETGVSYLNQELETSKNNLPQTEKPSIAVLPFINLSADPEQVYFSDGISDDIISNLSRIHTFLVFSRHSTFAYRHQAIDVREIARDLGARYMVEGSVRKAGERVRINVQLTNGESGTHIWSERYDRDLEDIFAVQDEITRAVVGAIQPELTRSEIERSRHKPADDLNAWDLYQRGLSYFFRLTKDDFRKAIDLFSKAIDLDNDFVLPHVALADCQVFGSYMGFVEKNDSRGLAFSRKAVELAPDDAHAHTVLGFYHYLQKDHPSAMSEFKLAIQLNPSAAQTYGWLGFSQMHSGLSDDGLENMLLAIKLSPRDPFVSYFQAGMAILLIQLERYEESIEWANKSLRHPHYPWQVLAHRTSALGHLGHDEEAKAALADLLAFDPDFSIAAVKRLFATTDGPHREHYLNGLRKAGLPEG